MLLHLPTCKTLFRQFACMTRFHKPHFSLPVNRFRISARSKTNWSSEDANSCVMSTELVLVASVTYSKAANDINKAARLYRPMEITRSIRRFTPTHRSQMPKLDRFRPPKHLRESTCRSLSSAYPKQCNDSPAIVAISIIDRDLLFRSISKCSKTTRETAKVEKDGSQSQCQWKAVKSRISDSFGFRSPSHTANQANQRENSECTGFWNCRNPNVVEHNTCVVVVDEAIERQSQLISISGHWSGRM